MELKSAWQIAMERNEEYEKLSAITDELLEHVALLEECWNAIHPSDLPASLPRRFERPQRLAA